MKSLIISLFSCLAFIANAEEKGSVSLEIVTKTSKITATGNGQMLAGHLKSAVLMHGIENLTITYTAQFTNLEISAVFLGEKKNNFYRFLQQETKDCIAVDSDIDLAVKQFIEQFELKVPNRPLTKACGVI